MLEKSYIFYSIKLSPDLILDTPSFPYETESHISNHLPLADSSKKTWLSND